MPERRGRAIVPGIEKGVLDISEVAVVAASPVHSLDRGRHAEIRLGRGLTAQVAASLCRAVAAHVHAGVAVLELHMPEVERIDSVGLAALHQVGAFTAERGVILSLVPSPALHRALLDAQLLEEFTLAAPRAGGAGRRAAGCPRTRRPVRSLPRARTSRCGCPLRRTCRTSTAGRAIRYSPTWWAATCSIAAGISAQAIPRWPA